MDLNGFKLIKSIKEKNKFLYNEFEVTKKLIFVRDEIKIILSFFEIKKFKKYSKYELINT